MSDPTKGANTTGHKVLGSGYEERIAELEADVERKSKAIARLKKLLAQVPTTQMRSRYGRQIPAVYCLGCDRLVDKCRDSDDDTCWAGQVVRELSFGKQ